MGTNLFESRLLSLSLQSSALLSLLLLHSGNDFFRLLIVLQWYKGKLNKTVQIDELIRICRIPDVFSVVERVIAMIS